MKKPTYPAWPTKTPKKNSRKSSAVEQKEINAAVETAISGSGGVVTQEAINSIESQELKDILTDDDNAIFKPSPGPQTDFLAAPEREVLYGGAKGGGKSYALMVDPLRYMGCKHSRALIIRRSTPDLRDMINKAQQI